MGISNKTLAFLMTRDISINRWEKVGNFEREIKLYIELAKSFKEIYFFTYGTKTDLKYQNLLPPNIKIISRPAFIPTTLYVLLMPFVHRKIFKQIDILKTNQMDGSWAGVIAKKLFGKKLVVRCGYEWLNYLITTNAKWYKKIIARMVEKWSYKNADKIIITSEGDKKFIIKNFKVKSGKIKVIGNYIDTELFKPNEEVFKKPERIIFVGRIHRDKNLITFVQSMRGLPAELVLVGTGPQETEVKEIAKNLGVQVHMLGKISQGNLPEELQKSSIFVLPSLSEGNPKALLEAMACGLACVGMNVKGTREIINDEESGLLAEPNETSLREKIKMLLENKELRDRLGANARQMIVQEYSLDTILEKEKEIYESR